jgi:hypothetical protein
MGLLTITNPVCSEVVHKKGRTLIIYNFTDELYRLLLAHSTWVLCLQGRWMAGSGNESFLAWFLCRLQFPVSWLFQRRRQGSCLICYHGGWDCVPRASEVLERSLAPGI